MPTTRCLVTGKNDADCCPLAIGKVAPPNFEQACSRSATIRIALRGREEPGKQRWPHDLQFLRNRIGKRPVSATHAGGFLFRNEGPVDCFIEPTRGSGTADTALQRSEEHTSDLQSLMRISNAV